jgi:hypothetical protein
MEPEERAHDAPLSRAGKEELMRQDGPPVPHLGRHAPGASAESPPRSETLIWPRADDRRPRAPESRRAPEMNEARSGSVSALAFGVSLGANLVLLVALAVLLLLAQAGNFSSGGAVGSSTRGVTLGSPTAIPSASASAAALQVAPSSVQLGCASGQRTQYVTLRNTGAAKAQWQATFSVPAEQAGVAVSPQRGELAAGGSIPIQLQNTTRSSGSQGVAGRQGVITFAPTAPDESQDAGPDAGLSARLSYTTVGCH